MPILLSSPRYSASCPLRNSISSNNVFLPDKAIAIARFNVTNDLPSPLIVDVSMITLLLVDASLKRRFVLSVLNCSATAVRDSFFTTIGLFDFDWLISAIIGAVVDETISFGVVTLLLLNSLKRIVIDGIKMPINIDASITISLFGQ